MFLINKHLIFCQAYSGKYLNPTEKKRKGKGGNKKNCDRQKEAA